MEQGRRPLEVGSWIKVYWDGDDTWYTAEVTEFDAITKCCKVLYEDGEREEFRLSDVKYKKLWGGKLREKFQAEDAGGFSKRRLRYIHHTLLDMADRLPEFAVRKDSRQWWSEWQERVTKAVYSRNLSALVRLATTFGEQINVLDIKGKVDVTTAWWKAQREDWQAKLKRARNYEDVSCRVKDLLLRALDWTAARNLFTSTGDTDLNRGDTATATREGSTVNEELKRNDPDFTALADRAFLRTEADVVRYTLPAHKRRKITKKTLGEVTQGTERRGEEVTSNSPSLERELQGLSKTTKKRKVGDKTEAKSVDVQVQQHYGMLACGNRFSGTPFRNLFLPSDFRSLSSESYSRRTLSQGHQEVQVPVAQSEKLASETCFPGTVVGGKKIQGMRKKKKLQDTGKLTAGNLGKTFFLAGAHIIEKKELGREKKIQAFATMGDAVPFVHEGSTSKSDARPILKEQSEVTALRNSQEGEHLVSNGLSATKIVALASEYLKVADKGDFASNRFISVTKRKAEVSRAAASETRFVVRRKPGRPRKIVLPLEGFGGLNVEVLNHADLDRRSLQMSLTAAETQETQQKGQLRSELDTIVNLTEQGDSPLKSQKVVGGLEKEMQHSKRGRPRKLSQPPVMESQTKGNIDIHVVGGTSRFKDAVLSAEDVEAVKPRKRGRPRKVLLRETCPLPLKTLGHPHHNGGECEENGSLPEVAPQRLLPRAALNEPDDANMITTELEGSANLISTEVVGEKQMQEKRAYAARTKLDDGVNESIVAQFTVTPKERGSSRISHKETADGEGNPQNQAAAVAGSHFHEKLARNPCTPIPLFPLSEVQATTTVGRLRTSLSLVVSEDAPPQSSKPVVTEETAVKYSRRHFRKSPGRPPKKVVQDERQEISISVSPQSAAKHVDLVYSEAKSQLAWKEVELTSGKALETGLRASRGQLFGARVAVIITDTGIQTWNCNHLQGEKGAICLGLNGDVSTVSSNSPGRSRQPGSKLSRSLEPQALQITHRDLGCESVPPSIRGNLQHDGHLITSDEIAVVTTSKKRRSGKKNMRLEVKRGLSEGELVAKSLTEDSVKNGLFKQDRPFERGTEPILNTATTSMHETECKSRSCEGQDKQRPHVADSLLAREAAGIKIYVPSPESQSEASLSLSPSEGTCRRTEYAPVGEESCVNVQVGKCDESQVEELHVACEEPVKIQPPTTSSTDGLCKEAEPEYPSWGDRLCTDSDDESEILPVSRDSVSYNDGAKKDLEQEPLKPYCPEEDSSPPPLATETVTPPLEQASERSSVRELNVGADLPSSQAVDSCIPGKFVSDIARNSRQENDEEEVQTNETSNQENVCVPPELVCNICNFKDAEDQMLLCEERGCTCAIHTFCLNPPLQIVPTDAWTCLHCVLMATENKDVKECSPKRFPPKKIQAIIGRRSNLVKDEQKHSEHLRMEYLVKWDTLSHWHDTWIDAAWFVGERKRYAALFESRHRDSSKIGVTKEADNTTVDERKPEWLLIDRVIKCRERGLGEHHPSELSYVGYKREGVQFLVKWQGLDYRNATWEETKFSKDMREAISAFISRHEAAEMADVSARPGESVAASISRQPDYVQGGSMYEYQIQGLKWLLSNFEDRKNVVLGDETGLGKTVQAIAFISCVRNENLSRKPVLVVAPKSTISEWEQEFKRWAPRLNAVVYQGEKDNREVIRRCEFYTGNGRPLFEVLLTSYELAIHDNRYLCKFQWAAVIVDEGRRMPNMRSKLGSVLKEHQAEFRLLMTGTPVQNTQGEYFSLLPFLEPVEFPNTDSAAGEFAGAVNDGNAYSAGSEAKSRQLSKFHEVLKSRMLRRVKTEMPGMRIPGKKIVEVPCALTPFQRQLHTTVLKKNYKLLSRGVRSGLKRSLKNILMDLKMVCNHPYLFPEKEPPGLKPEEASRMMVDVSGKLLFLEKLLPMLKEGGHRVLVFSQMTRMLDIIEDFLEFMSLSYTRIDDSTSAAERQRAIADFNRPECTTFIFLSSAEHGGLGINVRSADTVIIYDSDFNPSVDLQAQARSSRIGEDKVVLVYQLVTEGSVEEKILERSKKKLALDNMVMTSGLQGPSQTKETASDISHVLLHGLDNILDESHVKAVCAEHTFESVRKLLDRSIPETGSGVNDDYGYLGSVQGHEYIFQDAGKQVEKHAQGGYGEKWRELLSRLVEQDQKEVLGRPKRTRRQVKYSVEQNVDRQGNVDRQKESQEDDEYNPTSSGECSSDVSLETAGSKPSSISRKTVDPRLEVGQEGDVTKLQKCTSLSVLDGEDVGRNLSSFASSASLPYSSQPAGTLPQLHRVSRQGRSGVFSPPVCTGIAGSSGLPGVTRHTVVTGSSITSSGLVYDRVVSHQGIGIHLNRLIPAREDVPLHARSATGNSGPVFGDRGLPMGNKPVRFGSTVPTPSSNAAALGISLSLGGNAVQLAGPPSTSGVSSTVRGYSGLHGGSKHVQGGIPVPRRSLNNALIGRSGMLGGRKFVEAGASAPFAGPRLADLRCLTSPGGTSVQSALPLRRYFPPVPSPGVSATEFPNSVTSRGRQSAHIFRPLPIPLNTVTSIGSQSAHICRPLPVALNIAPFTSCASSGHPGSSTGNSQVSLPSMHGPRSSLNVNTAATYSTRVSVPAERISDNMATNPPEPAVFGVPVSDQIAVSTGSTKRVLSSARLKKSARNRHRLGIVQSGSPVVALMNYTNPTPPAARVLPADPVVSEFGIQARKPDSNVQVTDQSAVQFNHSQPTLPIPAPCPPVSSRTDTVVSSLHAAPVIVSNETTQTVGRTLVGKETASATAVETARQESTQGFSSQTCRETSVAVNSLNPGGVALPPIARAQTQRKPLWVPKGDAGLLMGSVRNT